MDKYLYWLDRVEGLGATSKRNLLEAFGSAREVYYGQEKHLNYILSERKMELFMAAREVVEMERSYEALCKQGIRMLCCYDEDFPEKLRKIPDSPFSMYLKGNLPDEKLPSVAIIGARECSGYGEYIARELGKVLGEQGIQVISGMAKGIDGISQLAAIEAGGISFGVLGCGVDICYPKSNKRLYEELLQKGGILSTYPPGTQPQARLFPPRNRIVSGLADVLVVIEARQKSGTSITVEMALEQGREIYAVPGRVTDRLSDGCNKMLKEGAHVFLSPEDFLLDLQELLPFRMEELINSRIKEAGGGMGLGREPGEVKDHERADDTLSEVLLKVLDLYPQSIENIMLQLKESFKITKKQEEVTTKLMYMCLLGQVKQDSQGWFSKQGIN